jgi:hypothetical protein
VANPSECFRPLRRWQAESGCFHIQGQHRAAGVRRGGEGGSDARLRCSTRSDSASAVRLLCRFRGVLSRVMLRRSIAAFCSARNRPTYSENVSEKALCSTFLTRGEARPAFPQKVIEEAARKRNQAAPRQIDSGNKPLGRKAKVLKCDRISGNPAGDRPRRRLGRFAG